MNICPICGHKVEQYHEVVFKDPFVHNIPFDGLSIYGAYSSPKQTICHENNLLHFAFYTGDGELADHRLVKLGVEQPTTRSPTDEYMDGITGDDDENEDDPYEDEDFPHGSLDY